MKTQSYGAVSLVRPEFFPLWTLYGRMRLDARRHYVTTRLNTHSIIPDDLPTTCRDGRYIRGAQILFGLIIHPHMVSVVYIPGARDRA